MKRKFFNWLFRAQLDQLKTELNRAVAITNDLERQKMVFNNILSNIDVSVDVHKNHKYAKSWAVISLQGQNVDYIKFVELGNADIREIASFLRQFERRSNIKVDSTPETSEFLRIEREGKNVTHF